MSAENQVESKASSLIGLRPPQEVATLACMGAAHPHRLSFMRLLLRRAKREGWTFSRRVWECDADGYGTAVYTANGPEHCYSLIAFSHYLDPSKRSDRVIATAWDATFTLFDGIPDRADLDRLRANVPLQEAGRVSGKELSVSRTNRSVRLFDHVVERLAKGMQPDEALIKEVGYLMRTTAVYGSGKLGAADYQAIGTRPEFKAPFQAEMLSVYMTRQFTLDLVEHIAEARAPGKAAKLAPDLKRQFGVGNSTGLGMAPYLVNHPVLLNAWLTVRETALMRVRNLPTATVQQEKAFRKLVERAKRGIKDWKTDDPVQTERLKILATDFDQLAHHIDADGFAASLPWDHLYRWADKSLSLEARELVVSLLMEGHSDVIDDLEAGYNVDEARFFRIDGSRRIGDIRALIEQRYDWVKAFDFTDPAQNARFWYTSEEKLEPRLGERWEESGADQEQPLAVARDIGALSRALADWPMAEPIASFLLAHPEYRHMVRRVLITEHAPYAEIHDNIIDAHMRPVDILRFKLSFFGATRFDPRSDRWVRIAMFQHSPVMDEFGDTDIDDWFFPPLKA